MSVLVDTPIWSELFRRKSPSTPISDELARLIQSGEAMMLGSVRQEVLSGVRDAAQFERLARALRAFPDVAVSTADYEEAAQCSNSSRQRGIQGSVTDFLLCALAIRLDIPIFTLDQDFKAFATVLPIKLYPFD